MIRMNDNLTHHFVGTTWGQYCWKRSQNMEHEISQMNSAFDLEEIRELRGVQEPWLTSEQFKDTLVEYRLTKLMVYTRNLHNLNSISVTRVGLSSSNLFSGTDWYLVNESDKGRQTFFFTPLNLIGGDPDEEEPVMTAQFLKVSALSQSSRAQDQGCNSGKQSHAIFVHHHVPAECVYIAISQSGDRIRFERLSTPRPAPKVTLKGNWQSKPQQQQQSLCLCLRVDQYKETCYGSNWDKRGQRPHNGWSDLYKALCTEPWATCWQEGTIRNRSSNRRIISRCLFLQDERKMNSTKSCPFVTDVSKGKMIFSKETSRAINEMGNLEVIELWQTSAKVQCLACLKKHVSEGLNMCQCGVCLRPNQITIDRIWATFAVLKKPYCRTTAVLSRWRRTGHNQWQTDHAKAMDARRGAPKNSRQFIYTLDWWHNDEIYRASELVHSWTEEYVKYLEYISQIDISYEAPYKQRNGFWKYALHEKSWCK